MAKKKKKNMQHRKKTGNKKRSTEAIMSDLTRLLQSQDFENVEEANEFLQNLVAGGGVVPEMPVPEDPLMQAQDLIYEAWEEPSTKKRVQIAERAIEISADCADAYLILAEDKAKTLAERKTFLLDAVAAGQRAIGDEFEDYVEHFWGMIETRPYMRARLSLAMCLWELDEREAAIEHLWEMLRLNPNDNQGVRDILIHYLLEQRLYEDASRLLKRYTDGMANACYSQALLSFWQEGRSEQAEQDIVAALSSNSHIPKYLLGKKKLPSRLPDYIGMGDEAEAQHYVFAAQHLWKQDAEALAWLKEHVQKKRNIGEIVTKNNRKTP